MKKIVAMLLAGTMMITLSACGGSASSESTGEKAESTEASSEESTSKEKFYIGVCGRDSTSPFQSALQAKMEEVAAEYDDIDLDIQDGQGDPNVQVNIMETFVEQGKDIIIVIANQTDTLTGAIQKATDAGIPVINTNCHVGDGTSILTFIGCDDEYGGYMQGKLAHECIGKDEGKVVVLQALLGTAYEVARTTGVERYFAEECPGIEIIAKEAEDNDNAKTVSVMQNLLTRFPKGEIDAIVVQGPLDAVAAADACLEAGREELKGKVIAFDYCTAVEDAINEGKLYGTVNQNPLTYGEDAIRLAVQILHGEKSLEEVEPEYFIDLPTVTKENIAEVGPAPWE